MSAYRFCFSLNEASPALDGACAFCTAPQCSLSCPAPDNLVPPFCTPLSLLDSATLALRLPLHHLLEALVALHFLP